LTIKSEDRWDEAILSSISSFRPDILLGITEAGTDVLADAADRFRCPVVFDLHGIGAIEIIELGKEYGPRWERVRTSCRWLLRIRRASAITVANPTLFTLLKRFHRQTVPIIGMTDVSLFSPEGAAVPLGRDRTKLQVLYAGNCFKWQGIDLLVKAIDILLRDREPLEFTLMGTARRDDRITESWRASLPTDVVHFRDAVDYNKVAEYVRGADALVIPRPFMLSTYLAFPQKLVDYMASGRAIVATNLAPHRFALSSPLRYSLLSDSPWPRRWHSEGKGSKFPESARGECPPQGGRPLLPPPANFPHVLPVQGNRSRDHAMNRDGHVSMGRTRVLFLAWGYSIHAERRIRFFAQDPSFDVVVVSSHDYHFPDARNVILLGEEAKKRVREEFLVRQAAVRRKVLHGDFPEPWHESRKGSGCMRR
jgi:hypothetical protein